MGRGGTIPGNSCHKLSSHGLRQSGGIVETIITVLLYTISGEQEERERGETASHLRRSDEVVEKEGVGCIRQHIMGHVSHM